MTQQDFARVRADFWIAKPLIDADGPSLAWTEIADLAERFGLTVYDAVYLELAVRKGLALASRDTALTNAARLCGENVALSPSTGWRAFRTSRRKNFDLPGHRGADEGAGIRFVPFRTQEFQKRTLAKSGRALTHDFCFHSGRGDTLAEGKRHEGSNAVISG
jgi:hypothetical protein